MKVSTFTGGSTRKEDKIRNYLVSTPEGATPKDIALNTSVNVNTVKTILKKMPDVKRFTHGWYKVSNRGDTPLKLLTSWNFHNLILSTHLAPPIKPRAETIDLGLLKCELVVSHQSKATLRVATDHPLNVSAICMVFGYFKELIEKHYRQEVTLKNTFINTIEFNKDYQNLRLDGVKAITLDNLITHFKIYQKELTLRKEHKTKHSFSMSNIIDILTQNPNELELAERLNHQTEQLQKLTKNTYQNYKLISEIIKKMDKYEP